MRIFLSFFLYYLALFGPTGSSVMAETLRVELDGSGDFTSLFAATMAAGQGDTVLVGAGRFQEFGTYHSIGAQVDALAVFKRDGVRIIGAGQDQTIIGPESYVDAWGVAQVRSLDPSTPCLVSDLTIENLHVGAGLVSQESSKVISLQNCTIRNCSTGVSQALSLDGCTLTNMVNSGVYQARVVTGCQISHCSVGATVFDEITGCQVSECDRGVVSFGVVNGCSFSECETSIEAQGMVSDCSVESGATYGLKPLGDLHIQNSVITSSLAVVQHTEPYLLTGTGNIFSASSGMVFYLSRGARVVMDGNHFEGPASGRWIHLASYNFPEDLIQDLGGNYWDGLGADDLPEKIFDGNDSPGIDSVVNYLPVADGPLPTQPATLGGFKAFFR